MMVRTWLVAGGLEGVVGGLEFGGQGSEQGTTRGTVTGSQTTDRAPRSKGFCTNPPTKPQPNGKVDICGPAGQRQPNQTHPSIRRPQSTQTPTPPKKNCTPHFCPPPPSQTPFTAPLFQNKWLTLLLSSLALAKQAQPQAQGSRHTKSKIHGLYNTGFGFFGGGGAQTHKFIVSARPDGPDQ